MVVPPLQVMVPAVAVIDTAVGSGTFPIVTDVEDEHPLASVTL